MTDLRLQYKKKPPGFSDIRESRALRTEKYEERRKLQRAENFSRNRDLLDNERTDQDAVEDRLAQLAKWKAARERKRLFDQRHKKPVFKVGIVHHKLYSPPIKMEDNTSTNQSTRLCKCIPAKPGLPQRITRATQKRLAAKAAASHVKDKLANVQNVQNTVEAIRLPSDSSFAPKDHKFKPPKGLSSYPLFGRVHLHDITQDSPECLREDVKEKSFFESDILSSKEEPVANSSIETVTLQLSPDDHNVSLQDTASNVLKDNDQVKTISDSDNDSIVTGIQQIGTPVMPIMFSPYVVSSRGKSNIRKELQIRKQLSLSNVCPTKETIMDSLNISIEDEERTAKYFKFLMDKEANRLTDLCTRWTEEEQSASITEDGRYLINQAVGQTKLLLNKKFARFGKLVQDCETGEGKLLVTCRDLQGFWDMTYMEVNDCISRFDKLEKLKTANWVEDRPDSAKRVLRKKVPRKKKVVPSKPSMVGAMIRAARKAKAPPQKNDADNEDDIILMDRKRLSSVKKESESENYLVPQKSIKEPDFTMVRSCTPKTRRSTSKARQHASKGSKESTPKPSRRTSKSRNRSGPLQEVQQSNTSSMVRSPLIAMKISSICKTPDIRLDDLVSPCNSSHVPGRSILKRSDDSMHIVCPSQSKKLTHKVNFNDTVTFNEVDLSPEGKKANDVLYGSDLEGDNTEFEVRAEKKLNFEDDGFEEIKENIKMDTPPNLQSMTISSNLENLFGQDSKEALHESTEEDILTKHLRNRVITVLATPRRSRDRKKTLDREEIEGRLTSNSPPLIKQQRAIKNRRTIASISTTSVTPSKQETPSRRRRRSSAKDAAKS
ncbi:uncharacterized protein LOC105701300 isoform X2 [Orussus abietinus]|uniref:uncharacterized protein LOC105701300 isoform X2 n=1 Tax=Orussus abietinus TaxID=222816 RepID=UPI0006250B1A|nr:uncharacterized protein LOC105701300 isoform X2 [Orussus abietinus]